MHPIHFLLKLSLKHEMINAVKKLLLIFALVCFWNQESNGQCPTNNIEFVGGEKIFNSACGNNSYQNIKGSNLVGGGLTVSWEVSFGGSAYTTIVNSSNVPISTDDLSQKDITDFILTPNSKASGDYRIRRIVSNNSIPCTIISEPVFLYYAQNQESLSGGIIKFLSSNNCIPASGTLFLSGQTGPILQWESAPAGTTNWTPINNKTNTLNYSNITQAMCFRALVDNICGSPSVFGIIDPLDKYSTVFCITLNSAPILSNLTNKSLCEGDELNLSVTATSNLAQTYQWQKNGVPIVGANSATLTISNANISNSGTYDVQVSNACGTTSSNPATVIVNKAPLVNPISNIKVCAGSTISALNFTSNISGATFTWTNSYSSIGLDVNGNDNLPTFTAINTGTSTISATITVFAIFDGCAGPPSTFTIEIDPLPQIINASATNQTECGVNDGTITVSASSNSELEFSIDGGLNYVKNNGNFTGLAPGSYTVWLRNQAGCITTIGPLSIASPPIPATPIINAVGTQICVGNSIILSISNIEANTTYAWSGPLGFTAIGSTITIPNASQAMSGNYAVIATSNSCQSIASNINIIVSPTPTLTVPSNQTFCVGQTIPATIFNSIPAGASINWINSNPSIGLQAGGTGDIPTFTATNTSNSAITATIKVIASLNGCTGPEYSFNITIKPSPTVNVPSNSTVCAGEIIPSTNFNSSLAGTTFRWTNSNSSIGLPASGTGNYTSFFAINTSDSQQTASITVIPTLNGCDGPPSTYNITVNPKPIILSATAENETVCNEDDGKITISATGNGPLAYSIDGGLTFTANAGTFTNLAAGSYSVAVKNSLGCITTGPTLSISSPNAPAQPSVDTFISPVCEGENLLIKIQNPNPLATYYWTGPKGFTTTGVEIIRSNSDLSMSGDYSVTASINNCVSISKIITIKVAPKPVLNSLQDQTYCAGATVPEIVFNANQPGTTYTWERRNSDIGLVDQGTGNIPSFIATNNGLSTLIETITVRPSLNGCNGASFEFKINIKPIPNLAQPANITVCSGATVSLSIFNSSLAGTTYTWTNSNPSIGLATSGNGDIAAFTANNTTNITQTAIITVTPIVNACIGTSKSYTITVNPLPKIINASATNQTECGVNDGTITVSASSNSELEFSIDGGLNYVKNNGNFTGLAPGSYTVWLRNQAGCITTIGPLSIASPPIPATPIINAVGTQICVGNSIILSISNIEANTTYAWSGPLGFTAIGSTITIPNASQAMSGNYAVIATSNSCQSIASNINIIVSPTPTLTVPSNQTFCVGQTIPATIFNSIPAGASINWINSNPSIGLQAGGTGDIPTFTATNTSNSAITATIKVIASLNGCTGPEYSFNITIKPSPTVNVPSNSTVCAGEIIPSTNFNSSLAGTTFRWTNSNSSIGLPASGTGNYTSFFAINTSDSQQTASITVIPTLNGCDGPPSTYNITVNPKPIILSATAENETVCNEDDGKITISATGNGPLAYSIDGGLTFTANAGTFTNLAAGSYSVAVKNSLGCITTGPTLSISSPNAPAQPSVDTFISPVCEGENLLIKIQNPNPLATYYWTGPKGFTTTGVEIIRSNSDLSMSGDYSVTASINNCVSISKIITIKVAPKPVLNSLQDQTYCAGATVPEIVFNANQPGTTYTWERRNSDIGLVDQGTGNIPSFIATNNGLSTLIETITVRPSLNGCNGASFEFKINIKPIPNLAQPANITVCSGATVSLSIFNSSLAGTTYTWTNSNPSIGLATSGNGDIAAFTANNTTNITQTAIITVTPIVNACIGTSKSYTITVNPLPKITNSVLQQSICSGASTSEVILTSNISGTTFSWTATSVSLNLSGFLTNGTGNITAQAITNSSLSEGIINYTITPLLNGCAGMPITYKVFVKPLPSATLSGSTSVCYGASATLRVNLTGKAPWTINYTDGTITQTISGIGTNDYTFNVSATGSKTFKITSVSDANSCTNSGSGTAIIQQASAPISGNVISSNVNCFGKNDGSLQVINVSGGFGIYEYSIDFANTWQSSPVFTELSPGSYKVYIRDATNPNCFITINPNVIITQASAPLGLTFVKSDVSCFGAQTGSIKITANGGTLPYTYTWSNGETGDEIDKLNAGIYTLQIKDAKGCIFSESIQIDQPANPLKINFTKSDVSCFGVKDGQIDLQISGGTLPYSFKWSNNEITEDLTNLEASNTYTVIVKDANGCTATESIEIKQPNILKVSVSVKNSTCKLSKDGMINALIEGGTMPYTIEWVGLGRSSNSIDNLIAGRYTLLVIDAKGCSKLVYADVLFSNCPPIALDDYFSTDQEVTITGSVASNDSDQQGESLKFTAKSSPKNGSFSFNNDGSFNYTPNPGFWGIETIDYEICNTSGLCAKAVLKIEVFPFTIVSLTPAFSIVPEGKKVSVSAILLRPFKDDVIIKLRYGGVAIKNLDYVLLDQFIEIKIPKGQVNTIDKITIAALSDDEFEGQENIQIEIISSSDPYVRIGSGATVRIEDKYPAPGSIPSNENNKFPINPDIKPDPLVSPNDDGLGNDFFKIENIISFPENLVLIFNRWGNEVFKLEGYNENDRVFKGYANTGLLSNTNTPLSDGVYYYLITTKRTILGRKIETLNKGYFILKR